jgi:hypothetical protein
MRTAANDVFICYGGARPSDLHLLVDIRAENDAELIDYIAHRRRWGLLYRLRDLIGCMMSPTSHVRASVNLNGRGACLGCPTKCPGHF